MLIAAGVTFYLLLALFPALAAFVSLYGFVADPTTIADQVSYLGGLLPNAGLEIIEQQLKALVSRDAEALGLGFLVGLAIALWSANNGIKALFDAMNVAYEEVEKRSFVRLNLTVGNVHPRRDCHRHHYAAGRRHRAGNAGLAPSGRLDGGPDRNWPLAIAARFDLAWYFADLPLWPEPPQRQMALAELGIGLGHSRLAVGVGWPFHTICRILPTTTPPMVRLGPSSA